MVLSAAFLASTAGWAASVSQNVPVVITAATEQVDLNPNALSFTSQYLGTSGAAQTITVTNTGTVSFPLSSIGIIGTSAGDFSETNDCPSALAAGASCTINLVFTPTATGTRAASLAVSATGGGTYAAVLGGTGAKRPAPTAVALVQKSSAGGGNGTSQTVTLSGTTAGNLLIISTTWCNDSKCITTGTSSVSSVTDSSGDTCAQVPNVANRSLYTVIYEDIWYCNKIGGGRETATVTYSGSIYYHEVYASEFAGVAVSSPAEAGNSLAINPGSSPSYALTSYYVTTAGNTSQSGDLIYSIIAAAGGPAITPGQNALNGPDEYQIAGSAGPYMNTWTLSASSSAVVMGLAAFRAASGIPGPAANTVNFGAYNDPQSGFEASMEAFENWLGQPIYSGYSVAYSQRAFDCVGGGNNCMTNTYAVTTWFPSSRQKVVWSIALTGCDHAVNLSGSTGCTAGHTIPLTGTNSIASGYEDSAFDTVLSTIKSTWPNAIIRIGWEMNEPYFTWGVGGAGGGDVAGAAYIAAFRHVAAIAHSFGFRVDWGPGLGLNSGPADAFYPGDAYVDIIGEDFYDTAGQDPPYYQKYLYGLYWQAAYTKLHNKSMAYDEWGCSGTASTDAHCANIINGMAGWFKSNPVTYFNFWNSNSDLYLSHQICGDDTPGACGSPYQEPLSAAAFLANF
jgi:hypothetical protein